MDKRNYGQLDLFRFCIPHSTDVTILYTQTSSPSVYSVTLYLTLCGVSKPNEYAVQRQNYFCLFVFCFVLICQFFLHSPPWSGEEHMHSAWLTRCTISNNVMLFCYQMKMFYLWSLRHIIVLILSLAAFLSTSETFKCSCSPYAFSTWTILLHSHRCFMYSFLFFLFLYTCFAHRHLPLMCSSKCLTNLKGLPLVLCPNVIKDTGYKQLCERFTLSESSLISPAPLCQSPRGGRGDGEDSRGSPH